MGPLNALYFQFCFLDAKLHTGALGAIPCRFMTLTTPTH